MLNFGEEKKELFVEIEALVSSLSLVPVEVTRSDSQSQTQLTVVLYNREKDITVDELEAAYNIIYPRYSVLLGDRDLNLEVSSPGLERKFKDYHEFEVFCGKRVRLYSSECSSYISGIIEKADSDSVTLTSYLVEDRKETGERIEVKYNTIAKAKLDYSWEDKK